MIMFMCVAHERCWLPSTRYVDEAVSVLAPFFMSNL